MTVIKDFYPIRGGTNLVYWPGELADKPDGFLNCDGSSLVRTEYPELFARIGTTYGAADATHFNLPDYRGRFFRGIDSGVGRDTLAASRTDRGDGTGGDNIGSKQSMYAPTHEHIFSVGGTGTGWSTSHKPAARTTTRDNYYDTTDEGRPANVSVYVLIKAN